MKRNRFMEAQIAFVLKQEDDGTSVTEVCLTAGIAETTCYDWRKKYFRRWQTIFSTFFRCCRTNCILQSLEAGLDRRSAILGIRCPHRRHSSVLEQFKLDQCQVFCALAWLWPLAAHIDRTY
ncbi:transposase [uncultured Roseobacter sp.]|uniref:transposase n=1 Tax=uncultured Roseobacter sp. TaxID=114847 RepID=UPI00345D1D59